MSDGSAAGMLAGGIVQLDPTAADKQQVREALLSLLTRETHGSAAASFFTGIVELDPTVRELSTWHAWAARPTTQLLAAVRRNSACAAWLAALPSLTSLSASGA
jgi:hypothetical protein